MKHVVLTENDLRSIVENVAISIMEKFIPLFPYEEKPMSKELERKRTQSRADVNRIVYDKNMDKLYNEAISKGFFVIPRGKAKCGSKKIFYDCDDRRTLMFFTNYMGKYHPDMKIKTVLVPAKRLRGQLDDMSYYDVKVSVVPKNQ